MSDHVKKATRQEQDPTGQSANRKKANQDNTTRLNNANRQVLALWRNIEATKTTQKVIVNERTEFFTYDLTLDDLERLRIEIDAIINGELETELLNPPFDWYYTQYIETATRSGVIQENSWVDVLLASSIFATITSTALLASLTHQTLFVSIVDTNYRLFKGLSATTSGQVFDVINRGIDAGLGKAAIQREITKRFQVSKSSSKRIVDTEVNKAYNNARMGVIQTYIVNGVPLAVQHLSALLPTTRPHHAVRHGKAFTPEQQMRWWDTGQNRINCHCSVRTIELNKDGTIKNKTSQDQVIERGKAWFKSN